MCTIMDSEEAEGNAESPDIGALCIKDRGLCPHIDEGINLDELSARLDSAESIEFECSWGFFKHGIKGGQNSNSDSKAVWICLQCGCFSCGGFVLPVPRSHAVCHEERSHHPLVVHYKNHKLVWCFPCNRYITSKISQHGKTKEVLNEVARILKGRSSSEGSSVDVDVDVETSAVISESGYSVRGLINLGNTCFFNSIMQNLFAIKSLRAYLIGLNEYYVGPLTSALRNLLVEMSGEASLVRAPINPGSLFFSLCLKAPEFEGYGQHDSHELLRCLLDSLSNEELRRRSNNISFRDSVVDPTFVDAIFGGEISSTVSCLECGHSSTIREPFLDLSLSVRTKKSITRRVPPVTQCKKSKPPQKRGARFLSKIRREASVFFDTSTDDNCLGEVQSITEQPLEESVLSSGDYELSDIALDMGLTAEDLSAVSKLKNEREVVSFEEKSDPVPRETNVALTDSEISLIQGFSKIDVPQDVVSLSFTSKCRIRDDSVNTISASSPEDSNTLQIQDSNKEDASSSVVEVSRAETKVEQDSLNFDGFGDLFNEPSDNEESGSIRTRIIGVSSESDPDEVDTADGSPVSVESCLAFFTKPEILSKDEHAWQCDNCSKVLQEQMSEMETTSNGFKDGVSEEEVKSENLKVKRDAIKSVLISKASLILTIQLKRFRQDHRGRFRKLNGHVNFEETIDLKQFMDPSCNDREMSEYRLVGVVEHTGSMRDGHYVAYVRSSKECGDCVWYHASDDYVRKASLKEVLSCQAYILFYERA